MAIKKTSRGFALLIAVIFMSVMLALGLALGSLGYKQEVLASSAVESQYAFYAADAGLECALNADQGLNKSENQQNIFAYDPNLSTSTPSMLCNGKSPYSASTISHDSSLWVIFNRVSIDDSGTLTALQAKNLCADVTIYKYSPTPPRVPSTIIFSQGYDVPCATVVSPGGTRYVSRGESITY